MLAHCKSKGITAPLNLGGTWFLSGVQERQSLDRTGPHSEIKPIDFWDFVEIAEKELFQRFHLSALCRLIFFHPDLRGKFQSG